MYVSVFCKIMVLISTLLLSCSTLAFNDANSMFNQQLNQLLVDGKPTVALKKIGLILLRESLTSQQRFDALMIKAKLHHKETDLERAISKT